MMDGVLKQTTAHALVVVDVQRGLFEGARAIPDASAVLDAIVGLVKAARRAGALVVQLQNDGSSGAIDEPSARGWELVIEPHGSPVADAVVRKAVDDGFVGSNLDDLLRDAGARSVVVCGALSEMCVSATARSATLKGYDVIVPYDAHGSGDIPAVPGVSPGVPAALVRRVAEWALGDDAVVVKSDGIEFRPPSGRG